MRQLQVWVPRSRGEEVASLAEEAGATHVLRLPADARDGASALLILHMPNDRFDAVLGALEPVEDLRVAFQRDSVTLLEPPVGNLPDQVADVSMRGPLEILVEGLQSLGGWPTFLAYSGVAGAIVWAGLVSNTTFLLTAAMLIAPYAAPAMSTALATARGDAHLLRRSVGRYLASIGTTAGVAAVLTLLAGESEVSQLMVRVADVSAMSILLPVSAGIVGALSFGRPDRTSIVSGAGVGMLIALALAPQAGLLGIGLVLGEPRILASAGFLATLQLVGINAAASVVFRLLGIARDIPRARPGSTAVGVVSLGLTGLVALGMLLLQWGVHPELTRETVTTRAEATATAVLDAHPAVLAVDATARFPLADGLPEELVVLEARVVATGEGEVPDGTELAALVRQRLLGELPGVNPRVAVVVVDG